MGMGYSGSYSDNIAEENIEKLAPEQYAAFMKVLEDEEVELECYAKSIAYCNPDEAHQPIHSKFTDLQRYLYMAHELSIDINYHDSDNGSRYDEVDGYFFEVNNRMIRNPELSTDIHDMIERKFYVTYG